MVEKIKSITNIGLEGHLITIEVDSSKSLPNIDIVGLPDATIKESKERIRSVFKNVGIDLPPRRIILNLAPSDIRKVGTRFDFPMAVAIFRLIYSDYLKNRNFDDKLFFGELGLDGKVKRINGLLPSVISAMKLGYKKFFIPYDNYYELSKIQDIEIFPISHFNEVKNYYLENEKLKDFDKNDIDVYSNDVIELVDFIDIKGHEFAKRALCVAASGLHNLLMVGPPGSGKTLLAKALQSILPPMDFEEILEISQIYSVIGMLGKHNPLIERRPFRSVHHTASKASIVGGGVNLTPGEISLAHKGILFFDEIPEFPSQVLDVLRQPIEDKTVNISRVTGTVTYPAHFMFVGAMNPCKCGYYKDREKQCNCSINSIKNYQSRISGPLLDRFDMIIEIPREDIDNILSKSSKITSKSLLENVEKAWHMQQTRFKDDRIYTNSQMGSKDIDRYIVMDSNAEDFLKNGAKKLFLSPRIVHRIIKLARTLADIEGSENIGVGHIAESMQYRSKTLFIDEGL